jgi:hypothetical protein
MAYLSVLRYNVVGFQRLARVAPEDAAMSAALPSTTTRTLGVRTNTMNTLLCPHCGREYPQTYFPERMNRASKFETTRWCKFCREENRGSLKEFMYKQKPATPIELPSAPIPIVSRSEAMAERSIVVSRTSSANRSALVRYAIGKIPAEDMYLKIQLQDYKCMYCKTPISFNTCHIDHINALVKGGEHYLYNIALTCSLCNLTKNARSLQTFCKRMGFNLETIKQEIAEINHQLHILVFGENWRDRPVTGYDKPNDDLDD